MIAIVTATTQPKRSESAAKIARWQDLMLNIPSTVNRFKLSP